MGSSTDAPEVTAQSRIRGSRFISIVVLSLLLKETVLAWGCSARSVKKRIGNSRSSSHGRKSKASPEGKKRPQAQTLSTSAVITGSFHLFWLLQNLKIKIQPSVCISVWVHHHRRVFQTVLCSLPYSLSPHLSYRALHLVMCMWVLEHDEGKMNEIAVIPKSKDREEGVESCIPFTDLELGVNVLSVLRPSVCSCYCWELRFPLVL